MCLFNLKRGAGPSLAASTAFDRRLAGSVSIVGRGPPGMRVDGIDGVDGEAVGEVVGELLPGCKPGDCVRLADGERIAVVTGADADGLCACLLNPTGMSSPSPQLALAQAPTAIIGEFDWSSRSFCMDGGPQPGWAIDALLAAHRPLPSSSHPSASAASASAGVSLAARLQFADQWLPAANILDAAARCTLEVGFSDGSRGQPPMHLSLQASALAYATAPGSRLALATSRTAEEACGTVVHFDERTGEVVLCVDNAASARQFAAWSRMFHGKLARTALHPVKVEPRPSSVTLAMSVAHAAGTRLSVLHHGALLDVTVVSWQGPRHGNRHTLRLPDGSEAAVDLNEMNHAAQRFACAAGFAASRAAYIEHVCDSGQWVEDAITGRVLKIEDQLLTITMASGEEAVQVTRPTGGLIPDTAP